MTSPNGNRVDIAAASIAGVVTCVPAFRLTNAEWPHAKEAAKMTGVLERRHAGALTTEDLCHAAARKLLADLGWGPLDVDALVYVTQTPGLAIPHSAYTLHAALGLPQHAPAIGVNWSCSGYVQGLWLAMRLARQGDRVLLLVGDTSSKILDPEDRATAPLFGDAGSATAIVGGAQNGRSVQTFFLGADGTGVDRLSHRPGQFLQMDGASVFSFTLKRVPGLIDDLLGLPENSPPDFLLLHQAQRYMLDHIAKKTKLAERLRPEQVPTNVERFGNCSCASIPLLLCDKLGERMRSGVPTDLALAGFGAGLAWAGARLVIDEPIVCDLIDL